MRDRAACRVHHPDSKRLRRRQKKGDAPQMRGSATRSHPTGQEHRPTVERGLFRMPVRALLRTTLVAGTSLTVVLLGGAAALADAANPQPGDPCTTDTVLPAGLVCTDG